MDVWAKGAKVVDNNLVVEPIVNSQINNLMR
jgi:hypothetical protein